jgi:hypothetical protein
LKDEKTVATKDEKTHFRKVAEIGCILCWHIGYEGTPCEIHHIRRGGRRDDAPVIGLCPEHHRGNTGIHGMGRKAFERKWGISEELLLEITTHLLNLQGGERQ